MRAIRPRMLNRLICAPSNQCPRLMPTSPKGMRANTAMACSGERKANTTMRNIKAKISGMTDAMLFWDLACSRFCPS